MTIERYFVDRKREKELFQQMLDGQRPERVLDICEAGNRGKSWLLRWMEAECRARGLPCGRAEFAPNWQPDPVKLMRELAERLGEAHFPDFCARDALYHGMAPPPRPDAEPPGGVDLSASDFRGARVRNVAGRDLLKVDIHQHREPTAAEWERVVHELSKAFCRELTALAADRPAVLLLDAFEHIPAETAGWLLRWLLRPLCDRERGEVRIVLAGRPEGTRPDFSPPGAWPGVVLPCRRFSEFEYAEVHEYFVECWQLPLTEADVRAYYRAVKGDAGLMAQLAQRLGGAPWTI